jgi:clan AA aspartic protease (TIGR02281 family)
MKKSILLFLLFFITIFTYSQVNISMKKEGGVYTVPCKVNGIPLKFIFDTGASGVTITLLEAEMMWKNGLLNPEDILWPKNYQTATGDISVGLDIVLREIEFGGIVLKNVVASIIPSNDAPLLLGQSVLSRIGTLQIDPINSQLTIFPQSDNTYSNSVTDIDGNTYPIVKIGNQTWMAENLKTTRFSNGEKIPLIKNDQEWAQVYGSAYCYYDNDRANQAEFGNLYNWFAIMDQRGICPYGWHVPSLNEYRELEASLNNMNVSTAALKSTSSSWNTPNLEASNFLNFNIHPGGKRWYSNGAFEFKNAGSYLWTSSSAKDFRAYYYAFAFDYNEAKKFNFSWGDGFSCRCIKE